MSTITTATIQSMLARNASELCRFEHLIKMCKEDIAYCKEFFKDGRDDIRANYKYISKTKKQIKLLAAIQRQLKDEIRERKWDGRTKENT